MQLNPIQQAVANDVSSAARSIPAYPGAFVGRGIVTCGGGFKYFTNAWVLIRILRTLGCQLPIQLWHLDDAELDTTMEKLVRPYGVECVNASKIEGGLPEHPNRGWMLKPFSVVHSPFREVLFIDADNLPIRNPEYLFEDRAYRITGATFWPDVWQTPPQRPIWSVMGVPYRHEPEFESGQMLINKEECWEPLSLALWMNKKASIFYDMLHGDKDTFRFAWHKFGRPFAMPRVPVQTLSIGRDCCGVSSGIMCQHDLSGERLFQHRNFHKWHLFANNPSIPGAFFELECLQFLSELREKWDGRIGKRSDKALWPDWVRELKATRWLLDLNTNENPKTESDSAEGVPVTSDEKHDAWPKTTDREWCELNFEENGSLSGLGAHREYTFWDIISNGASGSELVLRSSDRSNPPLHLSRQANGAFLEKGEKGKSRKKKRALRPLEHIYPAAKGSTKRSLGKLLRDRYGGTLRVFNSSHGIGDHITSVYACAAAASEGIEVVFHTRFAEWMSRVSHPGLTISGAIPPKSDLSSGSGNLVDLHLDYYLHNRYAVNRAHWYSTLIHSDLVPIRPRFVDSQQKTARFDFTKYVLLSPCSAWPMREWPASHWSRLAHLIREAGYEAVAIGTGAQAAKLEALFNFTSVYWAVDHPPEWIADAMLGAAATICNDSGIAHFGGLLGAPTIAIHAHLPPEFLWHCTDVRAITPSTNCTFCRLQVERGFTKECEVSCSALSTVGPDEVVKTVRSLQQTWKASEVYSARQ